MNGLLHQDLLAHLSSLPRALARLRGRAQPAMPLYRSEGFGEDLEAFGAQYLPQARPRLRPTIIRRHTAAAEERKQ